MTEEADALAELAQNRGFKLVRSRVRTKTKRAFGKFGLKDSAGKPVLGLEGKHPSASAEEVEAYLRSTLAGEWADSLGVPVPNLRKRRPQVRKKPAPPPPKLVVEFAKPADAESLARLIALLDHKVEVAGLKRRLKTLKARQLVARLGKSVIGLCGIDIEHHLHRERPVGRITILVVAETERRNGVGRMLVDAAIEQFNSAGCAMVELTSNHRLKAAHSFYQHLGFEETSRRFVRKL